MLVNDIANVFSSSWSDSLSAEDDISDKLCRDFARGITDAVKKSIEGGTISTTDAGAIIGGAFVGTGTGSVDCSSVSEVCYNSIYRRQKEFGNIDYDALYNSVPDVGAYLTDKFVDGLVDDLDNMVKGGIVQCNVSGTVSSGIVSTPVAGISIGSLSTVPEPVKVAIKSYLKSIKFSGVADVTSGNMGVANCIASALLAYFVSARGSTIGQGNLIGSVGSIVSGVVGAV